MIPINACRRIIKDTTGLNAGTETAKELEAQLEDIAITISTTAGKLAEHAGRKTVQPRDILLAVETLEQ